MSSYPFTLKTYYIHRACLQGERVTLASGLKLALVYQQISQVALPITRVSFNSFTDVFRHACYSLQRPRFEIKLKVLCGKHVEFTKKGKILASYTKNTLYCSDVYNLAQEFDNSF